MERDQWLERYRAGEREQVWHEFRQLGDRVREPGVKDEVQAVCDEMARRARHNVEVIVHRLSKQGYRFHTNDDRRDPVVAFVAASDEAAPMVSWLEERVGPLPMAVSSWPRIVGDVWLVGTHPRWEKASEADPLVTELEGTRYLGSSMRDYIEDELEMWRTHADAVRDGGGFVLPTSPDRLHKANVSGRSPYGFRLPDSTAEGLFAGEVAMPFVAYLNWVFRRGGFPGHGAAGAGQWEIRRSLADGLLDL